MIEQTMIDAYLARIGAERPTRPDLAALCHLQERHVLSVPFENLDYHYGREIVMDERTLPKIVTDRRGGGCYETNPALRFLLLGLGYEVRMLQARVWIKGVLGAPLCHLMLVVTIDGEDWLVDVGFGRNARRPLAVVPGTEQVDAEGTFALQPADDGGTDVTLNGKPLYRFYPQTHTVEEFGPTLWWYRTAPDSPFLQNVICSMPVEGGRVTLQERTLTHQTGSGRTSIELESDAEVLAAYERWFGLVLDEVPVRSNRADGTFAMALN